MSTPLPKSTLQVSLQVGRERLGIEYTFTNLEGAPVGLYNRLTIVDPTGPVPAEPAPLVAYIHLDGSTLHVSQMVLPVPKGLEVAVRMVPYLSRVEPGASCHELVVLPFPVKVNHPYLPITATRSAQASAVVFSLGAVLLGDGDELIEVTPHVFRVWPPGPAVDRQVVLARTLGSSSQPIPVLEDGD